MNLLKATSVAWRPKKYLRAAISPREQRLLRVAMPVVLILIAVIGWQTLSAMHQEAREQLDRSLSDIAWLQAQEGLTSNGISTCGEGSWDTGSLAAQARSKGITLAGSPRVAEPEIMLEISEGNGNQVLALLETLACQGAVVRGLQLETVDRQGTVRGRATLSPPVT